MEYYGACRQVAECSEDDLADFPRRMREWLFNVMKELADRDELSTYYSNMEREAEKVGGERGWNREMFGAWSYLDK